MAASILSFGMLTARAFWMTRRNAGFEAGSGPPAFTAMVMSLAMRANCFAMRFHRANIVCLRTSKMRPMRCMVHEAHKRCQLRPAAEILGVGRSSGPGAGELRELRLQHAHAPQLQAQAPRDLTQAALQLHLVQLLEHGALLLTEPLLLDLRPLGNGRQEALVLVCHARTQRLDMRRCADGRKPLEARLRTPELHGEQCPLDLA